MQKMKKNEIILGDCLEVMRGMPDNCVDARQWHATPSDWTSSAWKKIRTITRPAWLACANARNRQGSRWTSPRRRCKVNYSLVNKGKRARFCDGYVHITS